MRRSGRHLAAGHAVDRVVDEHHGDRDAGLRGVDDLGEADGRQVAVALVGHDDRAQGWRACGRGRPPARGRGPPASCRRPCSSRGRRRSPRARSRPCGPARRGPRWRPPGTCERARGRIRGSSACSRPSRPRRRRGARSARRRRSCAHPLAPRSARRGPSRRSPPAAAARRRSGARARWPAVTTPAWLRASRSSSSIWPGPASTTTIRRARASSGSSRRDRERPQRHRPEEADA